MRHLFVTAWITLLATGLLLASETLEANDNLPFTVTPTADLSEPWAIAFLPDGRMLVTEKRGSLQLLSSEGDMLGRVGGVPNVDYGGQGGLGDIAPHPNFEQNRKLYLSYVEAGIGGTRGAAVALATLDESGRRPTLRNLEVIWRQYPKVLGFGHYGHRIRVDDTGQLWISSGDRQKFTPAQDMQSNLGKILRVTASGESPVDNPFIDWLQREPLVDDDAVYDQIWTLGHRNPLGMDFDTRGQLWVVEMGPAGGDELNRIIAGGNYGYPIVSDGTHYDGRPFPLKDPQPGYTAPSLTWTPVISPGDLCIIKGDLFSEWRDHALIAGLSSQAIIRVDLSTGNIRELARYPMGARIRSVRESPEGILWVLEDERGASKGRLLKLTPLDN